MNKFYVTKDSFPPYCLKLWCYGKPEKSPNGTWGGKQYDEDFPCIVLDNNVFPQVIAENSPVEVELKIK